MARKKDTELNENHDELQSIPASTDIPEYALHALKVFSNYEHLYVTISGAVFTQDAPADFIEGETLYKNPFYTPNT